MVHDYRHGKYHMALLHLPGMEFPTSEREMSSRGSKKLRLGHLMILICFWVSLSYYGLHLQPLKKMMKQRN
ncbi:hypothetical protein Peur_039345 [Populus x canadensis]